ncbi:MAG TPA: ATP-binding protein [Actinomycetota bacterium]|nr:ATP-binding protein [Actinomycetota bacterium]
MASDELRTLLGLVPDGCLLTDAAGVILEANQVACGLLGVPGAGPAAVAGKPIAGFLAPVEADTFTRALAALAAGGETGDFQAELRPFRGPPRQARFRAARVGDGGVLWLIRPAEGIEGLREALLLSVAHDLRAPLSVINGFVQLLENRAVTVSAETVAEMVRELGPAVRGMTSAIDNLLDVGRTGCGAVALSRTPTPVGPLVERCVAGAGLAERAVVDVVVSAADVDPGLAERILVNLLVNADRYSPPGSKVAVHVRGVGGRNEDGQRNEDGGGIQIEVDDEGPGIPDVMKEKVFDLYRQLSPGGPGAGVGLYLVRRFAEFHGGRAWADDNPGGGASMRVYLPCSYS